MNFKRCRRLLNIHAVDLLGKRASSFATMTRWHRSVESLRMLRKQHMFLLQIALVDPVLSLSLALQIAAVFGANSGLQTLKGDLVVEGRISRVK